jgi:hypothetical protein
MHNRMHNPTIKITAEEVLILPLNKVGRPIIAQHHYALIRIYVPNGKLQSGKRGVSSTGPPLRIKTTDTEISHTNS